MVKSQTDTVQRCWKFKCIVLCMCVADTLCFIRQPRANLMQLFGIPLNLIFTAMGKSCQFAASGNWYYNLRDSENPQNLCCIHFFILSVTKKKIHLQSYKAGLQITLFINSKIRLPTVASLLIINAILCRKIYKNNKFYSKALQMRPSK